MLPDVINGQASLSLRKICLKCFNLLERILQTYSFLKYNSSCIELGMFALSNLGLCLKQYVTCATISIKGKIG